MLRNCFGACSGKRNIIIFLPVNESSIYKESRTLGLVRVLEGCVFTTVDLLYEKYGLRTALYWPAPWPFIRVSFSELESFVAFLRFA